MPTHPSDSRNRPKSGTGAGGEDRSGLGELLKRAREQRGLTVQQVSNQTKIPRAHLEALERDDLSALPVGFYQRAEVRAYAKAVHLDQNLALAKLDLVSKPSTTRAGRSGGGVASSSSAGQWLLILVGVLAAAWFLLRSMNGGPAPTNTDAGRPATSSVPSPGGPASAAAAAAAAARTPPVDAPAAVPASPAEAPAAGAEPAAPNLVPPPAAPAREVVTAAAVPPGTPAVAAPGTTSPLPAASPAEPAAVPLPAPPITPPQPAAALVLITEPAGARVTVNGIGWGVTPVTIRYLPAGEKRIRISKEGYLTDERVINVVEGRPARVSIQLQAAP